MSDLELLFLVLGVVYAVECAWWLRRGSVAFVTWLGRRWRPTHPGALLGNQGGGFILSPPLPPLGTVIAGCQIPLSLGTEGVVAFVASGVNPGGRAAQSGQFWRYEEVRSVQAVGRKLKLNGEIFLKANSSTHADFLAQLVGEVAKTPPARRPARIEQVLRTALDHEAIERRWEEFRRLARPGLWLTNLLFFFLFALAPWMIWRVGFQSCWRFLLAGLLVFSTATAAWYWRAHKCLFPAAEDERFTHFLLIWLSPATTVRARDALSRPLLEGFHPLAVARVLCEPDRFARLARIVLRELRHPALPVFPGTDPAAQRAEQSWREALLQAVEKLVRQSGQDPAELLQAPVPTDRSCRSYCPRCLDQFTSHEGKCEDCGGLPLVAFQPAAANAARKQSTSS